MSSDDIVCPLCGVIYQVDHVTAHLRLTENLKRREDEYIREKFEQAKAYISGGLANDEGEV